MFAKKYKKAYDSIEPSQELVCKVIKNVGEASRAEELSNEDHQVDWEKRRPGRAAKSMIAAAAVLVCFFSVLPVCAANIPAFYRVIEYISPRLADSLVPIEKSSSSQGVTMEVEAIDLQDNEAEIIVSVQDDEDSPLDRIHGQADLLDSYDLIGYGGEMVMGGCSFLTYDEETGKAYFKITTQTSGTYRADKLHFTVREILCNKTSENREIDLAKIIRSAESVSVKSVVLSGTGGVMEEDKLPVSLQKTGGTQTDPRERRNVLDLRSAEECAADDFTVTGAAYMDGVLRLQICMGDNSHADRHVQPFLVDSAGEERHEDYSVSWHEEVGEASYQFYEYWFVGEMENPEAYSMYGIFHNSGESVEGKWEVTFRVE